MSKKQTFIVTLEFESKITQDEDLIVIAENIARAIKLETNGLGIAPDYGDTYVENVTVKPQYLDHEVHVKIVDL